jgi:hypothetical protein
MSVRSFIRLAAATALAAGAGVLPAQSSGTGAAARPPRAIRRDIPLTRMIRRAFAAGTRDSTGRPGARYWQLQVDYTIRARLEPSTSIVSGHETVVIHNASDSALRTIQLRLDQNVFAPNVARASKIMEITDGMPVTRLTVDGVPVDLHPPESVRNARGPQAPPSAPYATRMDQTSARITLAAPVAAKGTATLEADWSFRVPRADGVRGDRMGRWADSLYQVAQWYPRVAVYDDLRAGGWDTDEYLGDSEFYNNFGRFDVTIDVPAGWIVGATGVLQNPGEVLTSTERERLSHVLESDSTRTIVGAGERGPGVSTAAGDRLLWHFVADTVADVAWATSNQFVWDATRATIPGRGAIPVNILYLAGHAEGQNGRAGFRQGGPRVRHALEFYSKLWMPYAFPQLTMVDGPENGMEYPMFIMSSTGASDHETGHQWWPMMVGVNETWYGFMDEGFNEYMTELSRADRDHEAPVLDGLGQSYGRTSGDEREAPLMYDANFGGPMYGFQAYEKAPKMLSMLGGVAGGDSAVWRAMSAYTNAWRFKHPSPWDYAFFMSNALHQDLGWFWNYWLFTTESVDGGIDTVITAGTRTRVVVRQDGQMPAPVILKVKFAASGPPVRPMKESRMVDSTTAIVTWPVDVWFPGNRAFTATLAFGGRRIESITLDPGRRFPDGNPADNVWPRAAATTAATGH